MTNPARAYLTTQVETTTQGELLIMLYEAAIKFLKRAKIEIENKDFAKKGIYISKAMAIIHELAESLNKEKGGDITPRLSQLYMFCTSQLIKANIRMDTKIIDDVINILDGLCSAYSQIIPGQAGKSGPAQAAQRPAPPRIPGAGPMPSAPRPTPAAAAAPAASPATPPIAPAMARPSAPPATGAGQSDPAARTQAQEPAPQAAKPETGQTAQPKPQPAQPEPPKLRTAFNAAKLRAANAYTNHNR